MLQSLATTELETLQLAAAGARGSERRAVGRVTLAVFDHLKPNRRAIAGGPLPNDAADPVVTAGLHRGSAFAAMAILLTVGFVCTPYANTRLMAIPGYMTAFGAAMIVINILLAVLLFSKGAIEQSGDITRLGAAYLFVAMIFIPLVACFPGGIMPGSVIGSASSSVWLWFFWHAGFAIYIIRYAWLARRGDASTASLGATVVVVMAAVVGATVLSTSLLPWLPPILQDGHLFSGVTAVLPVVTLVLIGAALALVCRLGMRTAEQLWLAAAMVAALFDVWLTYLGTERFSLGWYLSKCGSLFTSLTVLITLLHEITVLHRRAAEANAVLTGLAQQDGLTGLCNRRRFDELVDIEWRRNGREQQPLSLLMIDVDHFKKFNDRYGHPEGDKCLRSIAGVLSAVARRPSDKAARYGGEEFVLLLPATDAAGAAKMARRLRAAVRKLNIAHAASSHGRVTLSIGMATVVPQPGGDMDALVAEADRGLYRAKNDGRDRACWAEDKAIPDGRKLLKTLMCAAT